MADFYQTLIATIAVGSLYALLALGYTMVYGVLKFINFAHSDVFVLGAWTSFTFATVLITALGLNPDHPPLWIGTITVCIAILTCSLVGLAIERFAYKPLRKAPRLNVLITAIGVSLFLQNVGQLPGFSIASFESRTAATLPFGAIPRSMPVLLPDAVLNETTILQGRLSPGSRRGLVKLDQPVTLLPDRSYILEITRSVDAQPVLDRIHVASPAATYTIDEELSTQPRRNPDEILGSTYRLILSPVVPIRLLVVLITCSAIGLMLALQFLVYKTKIGMAMRAISHNFETAALMGVNVNFVISFTFGLGAALAGAAAFLHAQQYTSLGQPASAVWVLLGLKAFVAAVVGGIGNVRGAVLGGFLIAAIEQFGAKYADPALQDVFVFATLILVLLLRPSGILGSTIREKV